MGWTMLWCLMLHPCACLWNGGAQEICPCFRRIDLHRYTSGFSLSPSASSGLLRSSRWHGWGCDAKQKIFKVQLVGFASSKVYKKCKSLMSVDSSHGLHMSHGYGDLQNNRASQWPCWSTPCPNSLEDGNLHAYRSASQCWMGWCRGRDAGGPHSPAAPRCSPGAPSQSCCCIFLHLKTQSSFFVSIFIYVKKHKIAEGFVHHFTAWAPGCSSPAPEMRCNHKGANSWRQLSW